MGNKFSRFSCFSCATPPLPSASSSTQTVSNLINAIREDVERVKPELDAHIHKISRLFEAIETQQELQFEWIELQFGWKWRISVGKFNCLLNDVLPAHEASQVSRNVVQGFRQADWVALCFLLVSYVLHQFETTSNQDGCWSLLKQMYDLAVDIKKLTGLEDLAQAGTELIVQGFLMCCWSRVMCKDELPRFEEKILDFHGRMIRGMPMRICSGLLCQKVRPPNSREEAYRDDAVGIEEPFNTVTKLLQWESEERTVAVIVHGFGGIGKTMLADAVFARYYVKDCKYSVVRLDSSPDIVKWQKIILQDLIKGTEEGRTSEATKGDQILDFEDYRDGRRKIGELLQQEVAFIYIDNVVDSDSLQKLLPTKQLKDAKKLRVLITTRDLNVLIGCNMKLEVYAMNTLSTDHGRSLLIKEMYNNVPCLCFNIVNTVGIEEAVKSVMELLQWESEERTVAVIVHGFGGIGKTTLADAVFARYCVEDCKYSVVRLDKSPDIVKWQKIILQDLMKGTEERTSEATEIEEILDFEHYIDGRRKIGELLQQEVAFIYIDNVVDSDTLQKLLPTKQLKDAKKLRVLITTRDLNVLIGCNMKLEVYVNNVTDDINGQITNRQLWKIAELSGGIPILLKVMAWFIQSKPDQNEACRILEQECENSTPMQVCEKFMGNKYIFAYDDLPEECKNPFLDICYFFKRWEWETVANIVGESALDVLERRALVSNDNDMIRLHDVILGKGKVKAQDTRFDFTRATAGQIEEFFEMDMQYLELVKGLWFSDVEACKIPITKLISMRRSLRVFGHKMQQEESFEKMELGEGQREPIFHELLVYKGESPHCPFKWSWLKNLRFLSYRPQNLEVLHKIPSKNLKHIELDGILCPVSQILSSDIQQLRALQVLRLINFPNLEKLPEEWGEYLRENLKELTLSNCTAMKQLPGSISQLTGLQILKLDNCYNLKQWPEGCEPWSCLKNLTFLSCQPQNLNLLKEIPSSNLKHIELDGSLCSVSEILSSDIQQLRALQVLRLINFHNLEKLPEEWGEYLRENLKELTLSNCTAMKQLPGSISQLTSLKILKLDNCCNLRRWPKHCESLSSSLQELNMLNCRKLKSLPSCFAEALDSDSRLLFQDKGILSNSPQSDSDSNYEIDED